MAEIIDQLDKIISSEKFYDFDLSKVSSENILIIESIIKDIYTLFEFESFGIPLDTYTHFISCLQNQYLNNPYHNFNHAVDATVSLCFILQNVTLEFSKVEKCAMVLAMLSHDVGHFGRTGKFVAEHCIDIIKASTTHSPLEEFHFNKFMEIIECTKLLDKADNKETIVTIIQQLILSTDPATTNEFIEKFDENHPLHISHLHKMKLIIKCSDIGAILKSFDIHSEWSIALAEEFYSQGEELEKMNLFVPDMFNKKKDNYVKGQLYFFEMYVTPLYLKLLPYITQHNKFDNIQNNYKMWLSKTTHS